MTSNQLGPGGLFLSGLCLGTLARKAAGATSVAASMGEGIVARSASCCPGSMIGQQAEYRSSAIAGESPER